MVEIQSLKKDENFSLKRDVLEELNKQGYMDQMKAQLRARVIEAMEVKKKKQYGAASKYMKHSEISNPITKKVVGHEDGLLCAEIMREFMQFYKMNLSMKIFVPEMSLSEEFSKSRTEMERELGLKAS